jgi:hypothetical protein
MGMVSGHSGHLGDRQGIAVQRDHALSLPKI